MLACLDIGVGNNVVVANHFMAYFVWSLIYLCFFNYFQSKETNIGIWISNRKAFYWHWRAMDKDEGGHCGRSHLHKPCQVLSLPKTQLQVVRVQWYTETTEWHHHTGLSNLWNNTLFSFLRLKNGVPLKDDYRIKQRNETLLIRVVTEMDAGNYTVILFNAVTREEHRRSVQLVVNGTFHSSFFFRHSRARSCAHTRCCLPLQCLLTSLRRRWQWTMTCTRAAAAPPWGAHVVDFQYPHTFSGSGCPKKNVQTSLSESDIFNAWVDLGRRVFWVTVSTGCWSWGQQLFSGCYQKPEQEKEHAIKQMWFTVIKPQLFWPRISSLIMCNHTSFLVILVLAQHITDLRFWITIRLLNHICGAYWLVYVPRVCMFVW